MLAIVGDAGRPAGAEDEGGEETEEEVEEEQSAGYVLYRTSSTFRTRSFAAPGKFCTPVSTSLNA